VAAETKEQLRKGIVLFNKGEFFECHEALEEAWASEREPRRALLQALIHVAVGFYHCQRGNPVGACGQLRKGLDKLTGYLPSFEGINTERLHREVLALLTQIESGTAVSRYPRMHRTH
jgi:predicted metal-dependent hydrolase